MQGELLFLLVLHLVLTGIPGVAAALAAARCGVRSVPLLLAIALAVSGVTAMLAFWAYYGDRLVGETVSFLLPLASLALAAWALHGRRIERGLLRELAVAPALWALGSLFLVFLGFVHGGAGEPVAFGANRFLGPLPSDNEIPLFFSEWFFAHGHHGTPPVFPGDWLASDRPPLQAAYVMAERPFGWDGSGLHYQVLGVVLQQLWIVAAWALLLAARVGRVTRALTMGTLLVSGLTLVNGFFVWPKLLPAAMLLAAAALVITPLWEESRRKPWYGALFAALCGVAMLAHGSSVFGVIPLLAIVAIRGLPSWRWIGVAALVGFLLMAPWSAYQKYGDPPGNRLAKWTLAGVVEIDDRSTSQAVLDAYEEAGFGGALHYKAENFVTMAGGGPAYQLLKEGFDSGNLTQIVRTVRSLFFLYLIPAFGLLLLAPLAMLRAWRRGPFAAAEWRFALACFGCFLLGALAWGLLVIGSEAERTVIHVGTYLLPILGICGSVAGLRAAFPRFATPYLIVAALISLALYVPVLDPPAGTSYSTLAAGLAAAGLGGFVAVTVLGPAEEPESRTPRRRPPTDGVA